MKLEYIASALSFVLGGENKGSLDFQRDLIAKVNSWYPYHSFGVLFNGYTEKKVGDMHVSLFSPNTIQVDSGGLQMVTLGHTPNDEMRDSVYRIQAKYGTVGMCFDEIPLRITGKGSYIDNGARVFDRALIPEYAKQTALNIKRQLDVFEEENSKCRPMMIIQGNNLETYQEWTDILLANLPDDYQARICGISSGGGCIGLGELEDIERYFSMSSLEAPEHMKNHFHLLGIGAPNRIQTLLKMKHLFSDDQLVSYDSTKHTGGLIRSQIQIDDQIVMIGRHRNKIYWNVWNRFDEFQQKMCPSWRQITEEDFHDSIMITSETMKNKYHAEHEYHSNVHDIRFSIFIFSVYNMFNVVDSIITNKDFTSRSKSKISYAYNSLSSIKSKDDFAYWKNNFGRFFRSKRTPTTNDISSTLESFSM